MYFSSIVNLSPHGIQPQHAAFLRPFISFVTLSNLSEKNRLGDEAINYSSCVLLMYH